MDLNTRVDVNFARVDVTICYNFFFHFDTNQHQGPTNTQKKKKKQQKKKKNNKKNKQKKTF